MEEAKSIVSAIWDVFPKHISGKDAVTWLVDNTTQGKQIEWPGWFFEQRSKKILIQNIGGSNGPKCGAVYFDYQKNHVWDLKFHSKFDKNQKPNSKIIVNDLESTRQLIREKNGFGLIIGEGPVVYDSNGDFQTWHLAEIRGGPSAYSLAKDAEEGPDRNRRTMKSEMKLENIYALFFPNVETFEAGFRSGWLEVHQQGRNSNSRPRPQKWIIDLSKVPESILVAKKP